ncbi:hypothetical protein EUTSA_v10023920mg [Eutrema salsugineum]|uniref:Knottin scorpion toxin-like domain-containing protein n=1 Tax=Eutrema salsugineum TaxID=72664 RepID=V4KIQ3_EUTSA|nr:putative defensin-like protein 83 [Eutrema salsugineum]ESQ29787.1 hypothetical protein EUTSA_v10023920mg [Eutrema salsugineum]
MATKKSSSLLLFSFMVFALCLMPMISGQMIPCLPGECTKAAACDVACKSKGYKGGACIMMSFGAKTGACCCKANFESQDFSKSDDTNVRITN